VNKFILGGVVTAAAFALGGLGFAMLGFFPTKANIAPPRLEQHVANRALHASMERHAPRLTNPLKPSDQNLIDGMKVYYVNCALCHGGLDGRPSSLAKNLYPPPPHLISDPLDDPESQIFFTIRTGVRYTGMPAWDGVLAQQDMWKVTAFLSRINQLPPAVQQYWQDTFDFTVPAGGREKATKKGKAPSTGPA
jgi:mono/diheme cytochrome c family protein